MTLAEKFQVIYNVPWKDPEKMGEYHIIAAEARTILKQLTLQNEYKHKKDQQENFKNIILGLRKMSERVI